MTTSKPAGSHFLLNEGQWSGVLNQIGRATERRMVCPSPKQVNELR